MADRFDPLRVIGLMSGTSLDGIDAAEVLTDGEHVFDFGRTHYMPYSAEERAELRGLLGAWPGPQDQPRLDRAARMLHAAHLRALEAFDTPQLVGFHGQTLAHDPGRRRTHQLGDGAALAQALGVPVAWDFRSADVAAGGHGAPLVPFFHHACARHSLLEVPVAFVNLGGVGNITWVDPLIERPETPGALLAFDTGPANAPVDDLMLHRCGWAHDADGAMAARGHPHRDILYRVMSHPYFRQRPPKSLDRNDFAHLAHEVAHLNDADAAATLTQIAALAVAEALPLCPITPELLLVSGGGRRNHTLMQMLANAARMRVLTVEAAGLDGDMLEAQAFAYLAVRTLRGLPISAPQTTGAPRPMTGGRIARP